MSGGGIAIIEVTPQAVVEGLIWTGLVGRLLRVTMPPRPGENAIFEVEVEGVPQGERWRARPEMRIDRDPLGLGGSLSVELTLMEKIG